HRFLADLKDVLVPPAQTPLVQSTDRSFQGDGNDDVDYPRGVRHAAEHAGALVQAQPRRAPGQHEPWLLDIPEARRLLAIHDAEAQVAQRAARGNLASVLGADRGRLGGPAVQERPGGCPVVRRTAPLPLVIDRYHPIVGPVGVGQVHIGAQDSQLRALGLGDEIGRRPRGHILGTTHVDRVRLVAYRETFLIAAVDAVLRRLPPRAAARVPAQHPLTGVAWDGFQA